MLPSYALFNALSSTERATLWSTLDHLDKVLVAIEALTDLGPPFDRDDIAVWITDVDATMAQPIPPSHDATSNDGTGPKE